MMNFAACRPSRRVFLVFADVVKYTTVLIEFEVFCLFPLCDQRAQLEDSPPIEMKLIAKI